MAIKSLKEKNNLLLGAFLVANLAGFYAQLVGFDGLGQWRRALPASALGVAVIILNALLSHDVKAILVFWRRRHPLPGCRAFSYFAPRDSRIDIEKFILAHGPFPKGPREQNARWYEMLKALKGDVAIDDAHRVYLLTRDVATMSLLLLAGLGALAFYLMPLANAAAIAGLFLIEYLAAARAARHLGERLVGNVLAVTYAGA